MVVVKILINSKEYGVDITENNHTNEVTIHDTFHCEAKVDGHDTIFGTEDPMITIKIKGDDIMKYEPQCKHNCENCAGYETTSECNHGCGDCIYFDGGNCVNMESNYYGCYGDTAAADCHVWRGE